ncbi:hypothetical protein [Sporosarcina sp. E16_8]|uniref:hypothetical protein n=1 Tax=Sporosarcina sp. E16_8 TaxID=2789295 RepID=UPI001A9105B4|nr:hypothetical protein [Sporosarcina sp. E16_8]MBO0588414.1 hypothetical protein [Sporosarcina sp. E16_8]
MGFLKGLGSFVGEVAGGIVGGTVNVIGELTGSEFIEEIGDGIKKASSFAGEKLGEAASGTWDVAAGIITQDEQQLNAGLGDMGKAVGDTAKAAVHTIFNVAENGVNVVGGIVDGDTSRLKDGAKGLVKFSVVTGLAFGMIDLIDGADGESQTIGSDHSASVTTDAGLSTTASEVTLVDNPNSHHVEPHWRSLPNGTQIWVDGDGDTSVHTDGGWTQSNPGFRVKG